MPVRAGKMGERRQYTCRTRAVQAEDARAIKVRNALETLLWCDARVPDRLPRSRVETA
jgi:hypothetical protein